MLIQIAPLHFVADFNAKVQLKHGSSNLFMVSVDGELEGPRPLRISGKATFSIFWCDFTVRFDKTLVDGEAPPPPPAIDVLAQLQHALASPQSWTAQRAAGRTQGVSLRPMPPGSSQLVLEPLGRLLVKQQVVPLNTGRDIETFSGAPVSGARRFRLAATLNGASQHTDSVQDQFAPAQFFELSDDEKLAAPSFETMDAGLIFGDEAVSFDASQLVAAPLQYEQIVIDDLASPPPPHVGPRRPGYTLRADQLFALSTSGAAAKAPIRTAGLARFRAAEAEAGAVLQPPKWRIVPIADGQPAELDPAVKTWSEHLAALGTLNRTAAPGRSPAHEPTDWFRHMPTTVPSANLSFVPGCGKGAAGVSTVDTLGPAQSAVADLTAALAINSAPGLPISVRLRGPADVVGIDANQIVRMDPRPGSDDFEPNYFPCIEFDRPDFPWLFTPARAEANARLRPWLCLIIVRKQDGVTLGSTPDTPLATLLIATPANPAAELPDLRESWAWVHAQAAAPDNSAASVGAALGGAPQLSLSRLLCPRLLAPTTDYIACVVPTFELGRKSALGLPDRCRSHCRARSPCRGRWRPTPTQVVLPVLHHWGPTGSAAISNRSREAEAAAGATDWASGRLTSHAGFRAARRGRRHDTRPRGALEPPIATTTCHQRGQAARRRHSRTRSRRSSTRRDRTRSWTRRPIRSSRRRCTDAGLPRARSWRLLAPHGWISSTSIRARVRSPRSARV